MALELIYTSAEAGIKPGARGFCTVAASRELPAPLASTLESLSGYRHLFPPKTPNARLNPVACSHLTLPFNGKPTHVVSRIADAGLDYTDRTNKIAHHLVLQRGDLIEAGPAAIFGMPNMFVESWNSKPTIFPNAKTIPAMNIAPAVCKNWNQFGGDPGWGGVLAGSVFQRRPVSIVAAVGMNLLPLFQEAIALLPAGRRWEATFSTYYSKLPPGVEALWKGVLTGSAEEGYVRALPRVLILDLTRPLGDINRYCADPVTTALVETARTGKVTAVTTAEETASDSGTGLSFAKKTTTPGLAFAKKTPKTPVVAELDEGITSDVPRTFTPMPGSYELAETEWTGTASAARTVTPRRTAPLQEKKKKSLVPFILGVVTALLFIVIGSGLGIYYSYSSKVSNALTDEKTLLKNVEDKNKTWMDLKEIDSDTKEYKNEYIAAIYDYNGIISVPKPPKDSFFLADSENLEKAFADSVIMEKAITDFCGNLEKTIADFFSGLSIPINLGGKPEDKPKVIAKVITSVLAEKEKLPEGVNKDEINNAREQLEIVRGILENEPLKVWVSQLETFKKYKETIDTAWTSVEGKKIEIDEACKNFRNDRNNVSQKSIKEKHFVRLKGQNEIPIKTLGILEIKNNPKITEIENKIEPLIKENETFTKDLTSKYKEGLAVFDSDEAKKSYGYLEKITLVLEEAEEFLKLDESGKPILEVTLDSWADKLEQKRQEEEAAGQLEEDKRNLHAFLDQAVSIRFPLQSKPSQGKDSLQILDASTLNQALEICVRNGWKLQITPNDSRISYKITERFGGPIATTEPLDYKGNALYLQGELTQINDFLQYTVITWEIVGEDQRVVKDDQDQPLSRSDQLMDVTTIPVRTVILTQKELPEDILDKPEEARRISYANDFYKYIDSLKKYKDDPKKFRVVSVKLATVQDRRYDEVLLVDPKIFKNAYSKFAGKNEGLLNPEQVSGLENELSEDCLHLEDTVSRQWGRAGENFKITLYRCVEPKMVNYGTNDAGGDDNNGPALDDSDPDLAPSDTSPEDEN